MYRAREVGLAMDWEYPWSPWFQYMQLWGRAQGRPLPFWATTEFSICDDAFGWRSMHPNTHPKDP
jgi:hypothetical protein